MEDDLYWCTYEFTNILILRILDGVHLVYLRVHIYTNTRFRCMSRQIRGRNGVVSSALLPPSTYTNPYILTNLEFISAHLTL